MLGPACVGNRQEGGYSGRDRGGIVDGGTEDQAMVWIKDCVSWGIQKAGTGDVANIGLKIFHFIKNGRIVQNPLVVGVVGTPGTIERHRLARPSPKNPDVGVR